MCVCRHSKSNAENCQTLEASLVLSEIDSTWKMQKPSEESQSTEKGREPNFGSSELVRVAHVLGDPCLTEVRRVLSDGKDRSQLDVRTRSPWEDVAEYFNSDRVYDHPDPECVELRSLDCNTHPHVRSALVLSTKWGTFNSAFTIAKSHYTSSGKNGEIPFWEFCSGRGDLLYVHKLFENRPEVLHQFADRSIPEDAQAEEGLGSARSKRPVRAGDRDVATKKAKFYGDVTSEDVGGTAIGKLAGAVERFACVLSTPPPSIGA